MTEGKVKEGDNVTIYIHIKVWITSLLQNITTVLHVSAKVVFESGETALY